MKKIIPGLGEDMIFTSNKFYELNPDYQQGYFDGYNEAISYIFHELIKTLKDIRKNKPVRTVTFTATQINKSRLKL